MIQQPKLEMRFSGRIAQEIKPVHLFVYRAVPHMVIRTQYRKPCRVRLLIGSTRRWGDLLTFCGRAVIGWARLSMRWATLHG